MKELLARAIHKEIRKVIGDREYWACLGQNGKCYAEHPIDHPRFPHEGCPFCRSNAFRHFTVGDGAKTREELKEQERGVWE